MNTPAAATLRGRQAVEDVLDLLQRLRNVENDLGLFTTATELGDAYRTPDCDLREPLLGEEIRGVLNRRRAAIVLALENKGIRIAPDVEPTKAVQPAERDELTEALDALEEK